MTLRDVLERLGRMARGSGEKLTDAEEAKLLLGCYERMALVSKFFFEEDEPLANYATWCKLAYWLENRDKYSPPDDPTVTAARRRLTQPPTQPA